MNTLSEVFNQLRQTCASNVRKPSTTQRGESASSWKCQANYRKRVRRALESVQLPSAANVRASGSVQLNYGTRVSRTFEDVQLPRAANVIRKCSTSNAANVRASGSVQLTTANVSVER